MGFHIVYGGLAVIGLILLVLSALWLRRHLCARYLHLSLYERMVTTTVLRRGKWIATDIYTTKCRRPSCNAIAGKPRREERVVSGEDVATLA